MHVVLPNQLDYERLSRNVQSILHRDKKWYERGVGITTAYYYIMLADLEVGDPSSTYIYLDHNNNNARWIMKCMIELIDYMFGERQITVNFPAQRLTFLPTNSTVHFMGVHTFVDRYDWGSRGERISRIYADVQIRDYNYALQEKFDRTMHVLRCANERMDVI